ESSSFYCTTGVNFLFLTSPIYMLTSVFCIEPMQLFVAGNDYVPNSAKWDELSETQRQTI
ncbi:hypothetical protein, partial [uncultured Holdemanella sp.]|uniref:hypothetical protein n=1 Tax=uncultured Holdemanella sp. TaxID=1763549 RepID=UPI0025E17CD8